MPTASTILIVALAVVLAFIYVGFRLNKKEGELRQAQDEAKAKALMEALKAELAKYGIDFTYEPSRLGEWSSPSFRGRSTLFPCGIFLQVAPTVGRPGSHFAFELVWHEFKYSGDAEKYAFAGIHQKMYSIICQGSPHFPHRVSLEEVYEREGGPEKFAERLLNFFRLYNAIWVKTSYPRTPLIDSASNVLMWRKDFCTILTSYVEILKEEAAKNR